MTDDDDKKLPRVILQGDVPPGRENDPPIPYKTRRPKRRRKGELNDGLWAPGVKPKPKRT
jgi:hypothetical protein